MTRAELINGLEGMVRRLEYQANFDEAGAQAMQSGYNRLRMRRPATVDNHMRLIELYPFAVAARQDVAARRSEILLLREAIELLSERR